MHPEDRLKQQIKQAQEEADALAQIAEAKNARIVRAAEREQTLHTLLDGVFQELYGADVSEPFPIDMIPESAKKNIDDALEKFGEYLEDCHDL